MNERIYVGVIDLGRPVEVVIDPDKDRVRCRECHVTVRNGCASKCPNGHRL